MSVNGDFIPANLAQFFDSEQDERNYRLVVSADGLDKMGKTHWAIMTTPEPVFVVTADTGTQAIVDQARAKGRKVAKMELSFDIPDPKVRSGKDVDSIVWESWKKEWSKFMASQYAIIQDKDKVIRTLVWDTGSDIKALLELAHFGKLKGNARQDMRTDMNSEFHKLFWDLYKKRPDLNMVIIHRNRKQYVKGPDPNKPAEWNGNYERDGHNKIGFYVDMTLTFAWDPVRKDFYTTILPENPLRYMENAEQLIGKRFYANPWTEELESHFAVLGETIFPETVGTGVWE